MCDRLRGENGEIYRRVFIWARARRGGAVRLLYDLLSPQEQEEGQGGRGGGVEDLEGDVGMDKRGQRDLNRRLLAKDR